MNIGETKRQALENIITDFRIFTSIIDSLISKTKCTCSWFISFLSHQVVHNQESVSWIHWICRLSQISTSALRALPLVSLPADNGSGRPAHLPQADVGAQHPFPSSRLQTGVPRPPLRTPGHDGGPYSPHIPSRHDDQAGAEGLHLWLRWAIWKDFCCLCSFKLLW